MNKKLVLAAALVVGAAGMLAQGTLRAQDAADNSAVANSDTGSAMMNADNAAAAMPDNSTAMADNSAAGAAQ